MNLRGDWRREERREEFSFKFFSRMSWYADFLLLPTCWDSFPLDLSGEEEGNDSPSFKEANHYTIITLQILVGRSKIWVHSIEVPFFKKYSVLLPFETSDPEGFTKSASVTALGTDFCLILSGEVTEFKLLLVCCLGGLNGLFTNCVLTGKERSD